MSLYDAVKDAVKLAQKIDNIELIQKLLEVQQQALNMQEKQQDSRARIARLEKENYELRSVKAFVFADGHNYLIDPEAPTRRLCSVCTPKDRTPVPTVAGGYCVQCKGNYQ